MAVIGYLGDIRFSVSESTVLTLNNGWSWEGSANYASQEIVNGNTLIQFTGLGQTKLTFEMKLLSELGVDPMTVLEKIWTYEREGRTLPLTIGTHAYGRYRWTIESHKSTQIYADAQGNQAGVDLSVSLLEYLKK